MSLLLAPLSGRHARDLQLLAADEPIAGWLPPSLLDPRDGVLAFLERAQRLRARRVRETFGVCEEGRLLGLALLARDETDPDRAEMAYWVGRRYRGSGYGTAAARQLVAHGFEGIALELIFARSLADNRPSIRILEKVGLRFVGIEASDDTKRSIRHYQLRRDEWLAIAT